MMSRISSGRPIFALSRQDNALRRANLYRGVTPVYFDSDAFEGRAIAANAIETLKKHGFVHSGDIVLITQGDDMDIVGSTNTMKILSVT